MNNFLVRLADLRNFTIAKLRSHSIQGLNFGLRLNLVEGVTVSRVANAKAVDRECAVASSEGGVDVAVVIVVVVQIPVAVNTVSLMYNN